MASAALMGLGSMAGGLVGGLFGNKGATEAANIIQQGTQNANATDWNIYNQQRNDQAPYANAGAGAVNYLSYLLGIGGGPGGQVSGGGQSSGPLYTPGSAMAGMDGKSGSITSLGKGGFQWTPGSGNKRAYQFMYNDGVNDVYQRSSGGKGTGINIDYAVVGKDGKVNWAAQPPVRQFGGGMGGPPAGSANDPNFGSLMRDFGSSDFQQDPGYQFRLAEGAKALQRSAAAKGGLFSGGTLKDLTNYNQNFASNEFQNSYNRFQTNRATKYNNLASLAGLGQVSVNNIGANGSTLEGNLNQNTMQGSINEANARASGYAALGKGIGGAINSGLNWYQLSQQNKPSGGGSINSVVG
jgi:hypothetical protein